MKRLQRRISSLENQCDNEEEILVFMYRTFVSPDGEDLNCPGNGTAVFISGSNQGLRFDQNGGESKTEFESRVRAHYRPDEPD